MGRGLVRTDVTRCLTQRSRRVGAPTCGRALLPPVGAPTRGLLHPWAVAPVGAAPTRRRCDAWAVAPVGAAPPVGARSRRRSTRELSHPWALLPWALARVGAPPTTPWALAPVGACSRRFSLISHPWAFLPVGAPPRCRSHAWA